MKEDHEQSGAPTYRGRLAPSPTGLLHAGHARTFLIAWSRARAAKGTCVFRMEDLDAARCKPEFVDAAYEDLRWFGLDWDEGPDIGGSFTPYVQSERLPHYRKTWEKLRDTGQIYPSPHSRKDVAEALSAPNGPGEEAMFPSSLRPPPGTGTDEAEPGPMNWRFRVPEGEHVHFLDAHFGEQVFITGQDFGDFLVWRRDGFPAYEMAVVADDHAMGITEVVRGEDLLLSTARQILIYRALGWAPPLWCHCDLVRDEKGNRLAKRAASLSLRALRERGVHPETLKAELFGDPGAVLRNLPEAQG